MHVITINPESLFQALSDTTRLRIVRLLATTGQEVCLCELVDTLLEPQYNLSRHLKMLRQTGFLSSQKEGRWVYHKLITEPEYLQSLYNVVCALPDTEGLFNSDLKNFNQRLALRETGRCRVGVISDELKVETE